eukprot:TRINITY_DN4343_c0_g1_i1.p1 TRINITY_DN4343_c0_g1~~TRINITY_DN4343_c0_g1_i1.p1  ORF type:complete len:1293 (+),score=261.68 TRINITY_DN4343_c0_g1_i1:310-3879(+)
MLEASPALASVEQAVLSSASPTASPTPAPTPPAPYTSSPTPVPVSMEIQTQPVAAAVDPATDRARARAELAEAKDAAAARAEAEAKRLQAKALKGGGNESAADQEKARQQAAALKEAQEQNKAIQAKARALEEEATRLQQARVAKAIAEGRTSELATDVAGASAPSYQTSDRNVQVSFRILNVCAERLDADTAAMNALVSILKQEVMTNAGLGLDTKSVLVNIARAAPDPAANCSVEVIVMLPHPVGIAADLVLTMLSSATSFSQDLAAKLNTARDFASARTVGTISVTRHRAEAIMGDPIFSQQIQIPVADKCSTPAGQLCKVCAICVPCLNGKKRAADGTTCQSTCAVCAVCNQYKDCWEQVSSNGLVATPMPTPEATVEPTPAPTNVEFTSPDQLPYVREKGACRDGGALGGFCKCGAIIDEEECFSKADLMFSMAVVEVFKGSHRGCNLMAMTAEKPADCPDSCVAFPGAGKVSRLKGDGQDDKVCLIPKGVVSTFDKVASPNKTKEETSDGTGTSVTSPKDGTIPVCAPATSSQRCRRACNPTEGAKNISTSCHDMTIKKLFKAKVAVTLELLGSHITNTNEECGGSCSCTVSEVQIELTGWCMDDTYVDSHIQKKKDKVCPAICGDTCGRKKNESTVCSGATAIDAKTKARIGGFCDFHGGSPFPWCYSDPKAKGFGAEFAQDSFNHENKTWAVCQKDVNRKSNLTLFSTEKLCSGWSPPNGTYAGKGATCGLWGLDTPWCFVDPAYSGPLTLLITKLDGAERGAVPCKVQENLTTTTTTTYVFLAANMVKPPTVDGSLPKLMPAAPAETTGATAVAAIPAVVAAPAATIAAPEMLAENTANKDDAGDLLTGSSAKAHTRNHSKKKKNALASSRRNFPASVEKMTRTHKALLSGSGALSSGGTGTDAAAEKASLEHQDDGTLDTASHDRRRHHSSWQHHSYFKNVFGHKKAGEDTVANATKTKKAGGNATKAGDEKTVTAAAKGKAKKIAATGESEGTESTDSSGGEAAVQPAVDKGLTRSVLMSVEGKLKKGAKTKSRKKAALDKKKQNNELHQVSVGTEKTDSDAAGIAASRRRASTASTRETVKRKAKAEEETDEEEEEEEGEGGEEDAKDAAAKTTQKSKKKKSISKAQADKEEDEADEGEDESGVDEEGDEAEEEEEEESPKPAPKRNKATKKAKRRR